MNSSVELDAKAIVWRCHFASTNTTSRVAFVHFRPALPSRVEKGPRFTFYLAGLRQGNTGEVGLEGVLPNASG